MPSQDVTLYADWGEVLGDDDEFIEDGENEDEEDEQDEDDEDDGFIDEEDDDEGDVLGDFDQLPETSEPNTTGRIGMILFVLGLLVILLSKKEEDELLD